MTAPPHDHRTRSAARQPQRPAVGRGRRAAQPLQRADDHRRPHPRRRPRLRPHRRQHHPRLRDGRPAAVRAHAARDRGLGRDHPRQRGRPPQGPDGRRHPPRQGGAAGSASSTASRTRRCSATTSSRVDVFADLGVRVIQLTYNPANHARRRLDGAGESRPDPRSAARSSSGSNEHRLMVDLSHSGERTCLDAARASAAPISINHTGCRALVDLPRNKTDEELRLVAVARRLRRHLLHAVPRRAERRHRRRRRRPSSTMR